MCARAVPRVQALVLWGLMLVQTAILVAITLGCGRCTTIRRHMSRLGVTLLLTGCVSVAMGLVVSSAAASQDQATSFVPLVLIPQLFFAGAIIPVTRMSEPIETLSSFVYAKWAFATSGSSIDLSERLLSQPGRGRILYGDFFDLSLVVGTGMLAVFLVAPLTSAWALVRHAAASAG